MSDPEVAQSRVRASAARLWQLSSMSLSRAQTIVGLGAAIFSIAGTMYGYVRATQPSDRGELLAVVREMRSDKPIVDATVEVLTPRDALITSFTATDQTSSRRALKEGMYRVVVRHPRFTAEARIVQVLAGQTSEIRFRLYPRVGATPPPPGIPKPAAASSGPKPPASSPKSAVGGAAHAVNEVGEGLKKIFH